MTSPAFPFAAITGQPRMSLALLLAAVDWRLSVLLKGDKGSGKSTAARALAGILPEGAPFVNLPIGSTEDRLLGGLDLTGALAGEARLKRGLIHEAHSGVLYIDEVNLLADALTDALLDVAASGRHYTERDGLSAAADARFVLLASMNREEGALRPQLLDRFALSLDVETPTNPEDRALIVSRRIDFDSDPARFWTAFEEEQNRLKEIVRNARSLAPQIPAPRHLLEEISRAVVDAGVRSLRADLALLRAAVAHAALDGRTEVESSDLEAVLPLVLHYRAKQPPRDTPPSPESGKRETEATPTRIFPPTPVESPNLRVSLPDAATRGRTAVVKEAPSPPRLDVVASFTQSFRQTGDAGLRVDHLVFRIPPSRSGVRFVFVVDTSGSQAAQQRMSAVKGIVQSLFDSTDTKDELALITFRGARAEIALPPCRDIEEGRRVLEFLPTGGRTPLAHALLLAGSLITPSTVLILLTDGRANVPLKDGDPWVDALDTAAHLNCPAVVVDSSPGAARSRVETLAAALRASMVHIDKIDELASQIQERTARKAPIE